MREPDSDDYKNLKRIMIYIQGTIVLPLLLSSDKYGSIKCYVDAAFVVHNYMRSHTGGFIIMGTEGYYVQYIIPKKTPRLQLRPQLV